MDNTLLFVLLFAAVAIGWMLGRRGRAAAVGEARKALPSQYYRGLNYLLDGKPDGAVDHFIDALEVSSETLETHIALGNVLRRRGEVERAIRIHENLLARPSLPQEQIHLAHLELARDYISAGLLDRAERLLLDLVEEAPEQRAVARHHLVELYQSERDWKRALEMAEALLPRKSLLGGSAEMDSVPGQPIAVQIAHFACELAVTKLEAGDIAAARELVLRALNQDRNCVRASILLGEIECAAGEYRQAIKALRRVRQQDADYVPETIGILRRCYAAVGDEQALPEYLESCLREHHSTPLVLAVAEDMIGRGELNRAAEFLGEQLVDSPSLRGLSRLIRLQRESVADGDSQHLAMLQLLVERLIEERPSYRCEHCGFAARLLHWFCPGCKYWGTFRTIQYTRGD